LVTCRARAWRRRRFDGAGETPIVDAGHVLGPLAGREGSVALEAYEPVFRVIGPDYQERSLFLADGKSTVYLEALLDHSACISPCSTSHSNDSFTACSELDRK